MNKKLVNILKICTFVCFVIVIFSLLLYIKYLQNENKTIYERLASATGTQIKTAKNIEDNNLLSDNNLKALLEIDITTSAIYIADYDYDMSELNAHTFEGLCYIVYKPATIFKTNQKSEVQSLANEVLDKKVTKLKSKVEIESKRRSQRVGDQHICKSF